MQDQDSSEKTEETVNPPKVQLSQKPKINFTYQMPNQSYPVQQQVQQSYKPMQQQAYQVQQQYNVQEVQQIYQGQIQQAYSNNCQDFSSMNNCVPQQYYQSNNSYQESFNMFGGETHGLKLLKPLQQNKTIAAIIVSFSGGGSYDQLFTTVQQKSMQGTQVIVYSCGNLYLASLLKAFKDDPQDDQSKLLMKQIKEIDADCVVFNWQCCGTYTGKTFTQGKQNVFEFLAIIMERGHMAMFSDFSLKSLINEWGQPNILGPNPFKQIDQTSQQVQIRFKNQQLKQCPSAQLQIVGDMAQKGFCKIGVMGGTIVYTVDQNRAEKAKQYKLQILTVVTHIKIEEKNLLCRIGEHQGAAGHVLLTFPKGGHILTSMGHWVELMRIDTSDKKIFEIARRQYGQEYAVKMEAEYSSLDVSSKKQYVSRQAVNFVQNQAPCGNMASKSMKSKKM